MITLALQARFVSRQDESYVAKLLAAMRNQVPARGVGSPQEIANAMIFLLGSDSVTGDLIFVTGGERL